MLLSGKWYKILWSLSFNTELKLEAHLHPSSSSLNPTGVSVTLKTDAVLVLSSGYETSN